MRKRSTTALLAAMAVVAAGVVVSFFVSVSAPDPEHEISLPGQGSAVIDTSPVIEESNRQFIQTISVDASNVQSVIASLSRPEQYQSQSELTYYYRDSQTVMACSLWKQDGMLRISQQKEDGATGPQALLSASYVYLWEGDAPWVQFARQEQDADLYSLAPTYEDILRLEPSNILAGEVREVDGQMCVYASSRDPLTDELEQWYVLVENGLLLCADGALNGAPTYDYRMTELRLERADGALFVLPDGTTPQ